MNPVTSRIVAITGWLIVAGSVIATYWPTLHFAWIWDDMQTVGRYPQYSHLDWWHLLGSSLPFSKDYYRPLVVLSFLVENSISQQPGLGHAINIAIQAMNAILVGLLAASFWQGRQMNRLAMLAAALLYGLHPALVEGVAWVSGRFDLLFTLFILLGLLADTKLTPGLRRTITVSLLFMAALLSKETAVVFPLLLILWRAGRGIRPFSAGNRAEFIGIALVIAADLAIRYALFGFLFVRDTGIDDIPLGSPLQRWLLPGGAFYGYVKLTLLPFGTAGTLHWVDLPYAVNNWKAWAGWLLLLGGSALAFVLTRRRSITVRAHGYLLAAFIICLLPVIHFVLTPFLMGNTLFADRLLQLPLVFACVSLYGAMTTSDFSTRNPLPTTALIIAVAMIFAAWSRLLLPVWSNDLVLWSNMVHDHPDCSYCKMNLAISTSFIDPDKSMQMAIQSRDEAQQSWQRIQSDRVVASNLTRQKRYQEAISYIDDAIRVSRHKRETALLYCQKASLYMDLNQMDLAIDAIHRSAVAYNHLSKYFLVVNLQLAIRTHSQVAALRLYHMFMPILTDEEQLIWRTRMIRAFPKLGLDQLKVTADQIH